MLNLLAGVHRYASAPAGLQCDPFAAARLAGIPRTLFLAKLANYGVNTFRLTEEDLKAEGVVPEHAFVNEYE